jgi:alkanesulfonate monooxygenase SsuD/methylene tetrahydromethanopterin reductase-like flavin-dependent oxidoreductase (luciferase family)
MDLAYFTMPLHPLERPFVDTLREDREAFLLADRLGFAEAYMGEHVTDAIEPVPNSMMFLAWVAAETRNIRLGTGTVNLGHHHPAAVAAEAAMLDHMLQGRFLLGVSPGNLPSDAEVFGTLDADRNAMFVEALEHIIAIWTEPAPYRRTGRYWNISTERNFLPEKGQGMIGKPFQRPHPPILGTVVAPFSKGVIGMGERGWLPISANFLQPAWVKSHWTNYAIGCGNVNRPANPADWRIARSIFVADDAATAERYARGAGSPYRFYYNQLLWKFQVIGKVEIFKTSRDQADADITIDHVLDSLVISGTVEEVMEKVLAFHAQVGDFGTLVYAGHDWADPGLATRSMELMATEVMPRVNAELARRARLAPPDRRAAI